MRINRGSQSTQMAKVRTVKTPGRRRCSLSRPWGLVARVHAERDGASDVDRMLFGLDPQIAPPCRALRPACIAWPARLAR